MGSKGGSNEGSIFGGTDRTGPEEEEYGRVERKLTLPGAVMCGSDLWILESSPCIQYFNLAWVGNTLKWLMDVRLLMFGSQMIIRFCYSYLVPFAGEGHLRVDRAALRAV